MNEAPSAGGFPPAFFSPKGAMMSSISIFVDESGERGQESEYYLLTLVFHDQNEDILERIRMYEQALRDRRLPDIPFHAGPLFNGHDDYESIPIRLSGICQSPIRHLLTASMIFEVSKNLKHT